MRGLAQRLGGLADEYELAGPEYASSPETTYLGPNVLILSPGERSDLQSGKPFGTAVHNPPVQWVVADNEAVPFHPHTSPQANPPLPPPDYAAGRLRAVEGGGGYRTNVVRSDFDCLMRRIPYSSQLPIQDDIELCEICRKVLSHVVRGDPDQSLSRRPTLQTHAVLYDRITWRTPPTAVDTASAGAATTVTTDLLPRPDSPAGRPGRWSVAYRATPAGGLEFSDLRLIDRPGDVFAHATNVLKSVSFTNLAAVFPNLPDVVLSYDQAFANTAHPPKLEIARDGGLGEQYRIGVRLQLTWDLPGKCVIEGTFCLVLRDIRNDFDPGGAAMACKFYPQMSLRYRRASQDAPFMAPSQFKATVSMVANNVIPPPPNLSQLPHELRHMNWDQQSVTLATDSNSTDLPDDNVYEPVPGSVNLRWQSGRMLSGVDTDPVAGLPGSFARLAHLVGGQPGLPHWSWLFDYVTWLEAGKSRTFTAVYADREENGLGERRLQVPWPVAEDQDGGPENYVMTVIKSPRQGALTASTLMPTWGPMTAGPSSPPRSVPTYACISTGDGGRWRRLEQTTSKPSWAGETGHPGAVRTPRSAGHSSLPTSISTSPLTGWRPDRRPGSITRLPRTVLAGVSTKWSWSRAWGWRSATAASHGICSLRSPAASASRRMSRPH